MDGESSYESDISESWSLIDINLNEDSVSVTNAQSPLKDSNSSDTNYVNLNKLDAENCRGQCGEWMTDYSRCCDSDSGTDAQRESEDSLPEPKYVNIEKLDIKDFGRECREWATDFKKCCHSGIHLSVDNHESLNNDESDRGSEEDRNDSGDAESIEILGMDGNEYDSEIEKLDISMIDSQELKNNTYQSDDRESWDENFTNKIRSINSTVIKQKRNLVRCSESSDNIVNRRQSDEKALKVLLDAASNHVMCKHYRNNVVNTVLSLSMGVIFAGVACIAIGHFLGVQDAAETAVELVDALKKLQMENVALQSRLSKLNRAVFKRDINSKFELPSMKPQESVSYEDRSCFGPARTKTTSINYSALSEIQSSLKSIQWLSKLENVINDKTESDDHKINFSSIENYIHDQLDMLNSKKVEGIKRLEHSDKKISKVLQKIIERLSASQDNIEKLYSRLVRLKNKMTKKLANFIPNEPSRRVPVTEHDLNFIQWYPSVKNAVRECSKSIRVFKFPQPEEFYKTENDSGLAGKQKIDKNKTKKEKDEKRQKKEGKRRRKRERTLRKEKSKDVEKKYKKKPKQETKMSEKMSKEKYIVDKPELMKFGKFNETRESYKKVPREKSEDKPRRKIKKLKKLKIIRTVLSKSNKGNHMKNNLYSQICSGNECFNLTGYWFFKYTDGREEFRRYQKLSDWQFDRAKGRMEHRDEDDTVSWQFMRSMARENKRSRI